MLKQDMAEHFQYEIVRFKRNGSRPKIMRRNLTLADARDSKGKWFDGFRKQ